MFLLFPPAAADLIVVSADLCKAAGVEWKPATYLSVWLIVGDYSSDLCRLFQDIFSSSSTEFPWRLLASMDLRRTPVINRSTSELGIKGGLN